MDIDKNNGNHFWRDAIDKKILDVGISFGLLSEGKKATPGCKQLSGHLVFDVKIDSKIRGRCVLHGQKTPEPIGSTYPRAVS